MATSHHIPSATPVAASVSPPALVKPPSGIPSLMPSTSRAGESKAHASEDLSSIITPEMSDVTRLRHFVLALRREPKATRRLSEWKRSAQVVRVISRWPLTVARRTARGTEAYRSTLVLSQQSHIVLRCLAREVPWHP